MNFFSLSNFDFDAFFMVIFVDLVLSGDNAIIIGMAAAALPGALRRKAIVWGIGLAVVFRIILASLTFYLLQLTGIKLLGALLLLGVCYGMWRDLKNNKVDVPPENDQDNFGKKNQEGLSNNLLTEKNETNLALASPEFRRAMMKIIIADISMSLDNVLAVAGIARENIAMMIFGLVLSIVLMAVGATFVARILEKFHWLGYVGLLIILYVALDMGYDGVLEITKQFNF